VSPPIGDSDEREVSKVPPQKNGYESRDAPLSKSETERRTMNLQKSTFPA